MAPSSAKEYFPHGLKVAVLLSAILLSCLPFLPSKSVGLQQSSYSESLEQRKLVLGSKPPSCVNKCMSCRPCMATLVIPPHDEDQKKNKNKKGFRASSSSSLSSSSHGEDDSYYLLSWKCRCGDKLYKP